LRRMAIPDQSEIGDEFCQRHGGDVAIFLDGNEVRHVVSFDIPGGRVTRLKRLPDDSGFDVDLKKGVARLETLKGKVAVCWAEPERLYA
jgi:hypothetical protein